MNIRAVALLLLLIAPGAAAQPASTGGLRVPDAVQFVGAPAGTPLSGPALDVRTQKVGSLLRCPVCQGMAVSDSPAEMAVNMKLQVRELLARGYTEAQILQYFELSYGQFVLLRPKFEGVNRLVWFLPVFALIAGGLILYFALRRLTKRPAAPVEPPATGMDHPDDVYLARVRHLVTGDEKQ